MYDKNNYRLKKREKKRKGFSAFLKAKMVLKHNLLDHKYLIIITYLNNT